MRFLVMNERISAAEGGEEEGGWKRCHKDAGQQCGRVAGGRGE